MHDDIYAKYVASKSPSESKEGYDFANSIKTKGLKEYRDKASNLSMIAAVVDNRPLCFAEKAGIKQIFSFLSGGKFTGVSARVVMDSAIDFEVLHLNQSIKKLLARLVSISITTDIWTSITLDPYLAVTAHGITADTFELKHVVLALRYLPGSHTADILSATLNSVLVKWKITEKYYSGTCDGAAAQQLAMDHVGLVDNAWIFWCNCHLLNLCVQDALKLVQPTLIKFRETVKGVRNSSLASESLAKFYREQNEEPKKLALDCITRWNSTLEMIKSCMRNRNGIDTLIIEPLHRTYIKMEDELDLEDIFLRKHKMIVESNLIGDVAASISVLQNADWVFAVHLVKLLKPFDDATKMLSSCMMPTLPLCLPVLNVVLSQLEAVTQVIKCEKEANVEDHLNPAYLSLFKVADQLRASVVARLDPTDSDDPCNLPLIVACYLHPGLKEFNCLSAVSEHCKQLARHQIVTEFERKIRNNIEFQDIPQRQKKSIRDVQQSQGNITPKISSCLKPSEQSKKLKLAAIASMFGSVATTLEPKCPTTIDEAINQKVLHLKGLMIEYESMTATSEDCDPLLWWKGLDSRFKPLVEFAAMYLAIPCSSTASERLFSASGLTASKLRNRLKPRNLECLTMIGQNKEILRDMGYLPKEATNEDDVEEDEETLSEND